MKDGNKETHCVMKMSAHPGTEYISYLNALQFWKAVEEKYRERKKQWMEANARMVAAKLAAIRARKDLEDAKRASGGGHLVESDNGGIPPEEEDYEDAREEEFSDVDADMFADPGDRLFGGLDAHSWNKIRNDLMHIHRCTDMQQKRRKTIRRLLVAILIGFWFFVGGLFLYYKSNNESFESLETEPHKPTTACRFHCDSKTVIEEFVNMLFPKNNIDEEI